MKRQDQNRVNRCILCLVAGILLLSPFSAFGMHASFYLDRIDALGRQYGIQRVINTLFEGRRETITIEYRGLIMDGFSLIPTPDLVNARTIARDLRAMKIGLSEFEARLKNCPDRASVTGQLREGFETRLERFYLHALETRDRQGKAADSRARSAMDEAADLSGKLMAAARMAHVRSIEELIGQGADVNCRDRNGNTPLMAVASFSQYSTDRQDPIRAARLLLDAGADIDLVNRHGRPAISKAIEKGRPDMAGLLLAEGAALDVDKEALWMLTLMDKGREEMLMWSVRNGISLEYRRVGSTPFLWALADYPSWARLLVSLGADMCVSNDAGRSALMYAVQCQDEGMFKIILEGCGREMLLRKKRDGATVLHDSAFHAKAGQVALLLAAGAPALEKDRAGRTALHKSAQNRDDSKVAGAIAVAKQLLDAGIGVDEEDASGDTALILAAEKGVPEYIRLLLARGADPFKLNRVGVSAAHVMATRGRTDAVMEIIRFFQAAGQPRPLQNAPTPLVAEAIARNNPDTALAFMAGGADIEKRTRGGETPLMAAVMVPERISVARALIENGADVNAISPTKLNALDLSLQMRNVEAALLLLESGADITRRGQGGRTALHRAAVAGNEAVLARLVEMGVALNVQDDSGETPLMVSEELESARILVEAGADMGIRDLKGKTALDHAVAWNRPEVAAYLEQQGR